jgi:hypothetical protein
MLYPIPHFTNESAGLLGTSYIPALTGGIVILNGEYHSVTVIKCQKM